MGISRDDDDEDETAAEAPEESAAPEDGGEEESAPEDNEGGEEEVPAAAVASPAPPASLPGEVVVTPPAALAEERAKALQDYLMAKYGEAADDSGIKAAREAAGNQNLIANIGHAFETMGRANAQAHGSRVGVDDNFYNGLKAQGQQGVQQAMLDRQSKINQFMQENALKQQVAQNMLARGTAEQKVQAQKWLQEFNEKKLALSKEENALKYKTSAENTALKVQQLAEAAQQRALVASEGHKNRQAAQASQTSAKEDATLDKDERAFADSLNSEKGRAGNYGKNMQRVQAGDRILTLINSKDANGQPVDPNNLSPSQVAEIARDFDAMQGMGGSGSVETFKHILPSSMKGDAAKFWSYIEGGPQPAGMGEFVKQLQDSTLRQRETALGAAKKTETAISEGYDRLRTKRPDRYKQILNSTVASQMAAEAPDSGNSGGGKSAASLTAEDRKALDWAKKNPKDPRAAAIMRLHSPAADIPTMVGAQ